VKILVIILTLIQILIASIYAEIRFVSKTGSSQAPYSSWATAADRIQKAINICNLGDTVYVGNGVYKEQLEYGKGISVIGSGMDSCILDTREICTINDWYVVTINGYGNIGGFTILCSRFNNSGVGITIWGTRQPFASRVENNKILYASSGITTFGSNLIIRSNIIREVYYGMNIDLTGYLHATVENNVINCVATGLYFPFRGYPTIRHNIINPEGNFSEGIQCVSYDSVYIYNNLCFSQNASGGIGFGEAPSRIHNNLVCGSYNSFAFVCSPQNVNISNNLAINKDQGIGITRGDGNSIKYNNSWGGVRNFINFSPDSTNMSVDPMVVNADSLDFHLQMYSPMIDAGDPTILDVDGTRSDIGLYGGPYGESYTYKDLAPRAPHNLTSSINGTLLKINWAKNTEADFAYYRIYRDTIPGFIPDTTKRIAKTNDTTYTELFKPGRNYYYKISATDNQGNESPKSEEVKLITGVNNKPVIQTEDYTLFANYPNPFNPSTKICYRLRKAGNVSLKVYDIKGSLVKQILNKWQSAGYYEEEFTGEKGQTTDYVERLASGVYILWMDVKNENNIPVYTTSRKMMMLK